MKSKWWLMGLLVGLVIACLAPLASSSPDGLERVAADNGFASATQNAPFQIIDNYLFPGIQNQALATIISGVTGTVLLFIVVYVLSWLIVSVKRRSA